MLNNSFYLECEDCGCHDVIVFPPDTQEITHAILPFVCRNCGKLNTIDCKIDGISEDGKLQLSPYQEPKIIIA